MGDVCDNMKAPEYRMVPLLIVMIIHRAVSVTREG